MYIVTIEVEWDAAHRLMNYEGPCKYNHGHRYRALIAFKSTKLNETDFVVDFSKVKKSIREWINKYWDHGTICNNKDRSYYLFLESEGNKIYRIQGNPTAENMSEHLYNIISKELHYFDIIESVTIYETPTSSATYQRI